MKKKLNKSSPFLYSSTQKLPNHHSSLYKSCSTTCKNHHHHHHLSTKSSTTKCFNSFTKCSRFHNPDLPQFPKKNLEKNIHKITTEQILKLDAPPTSKTSRNRMNTQNIQKYNLKKLSFSLSLFLSHTHTNTHTKGKEVRIDKRTKKISENHPL